MNKILLIVLLVTLSSCTSIKVQSINPDEHKVHHVCIEQNPKVIVKEFPGVIEEGLERHGITSEVYTGRKPNYCEYYLTYTALKTWDIGMYMHHAELHLYKENQKIAYAEYHLNGKGGFALNKWASVDSKMDPVIDQLLSGYSPEMVDAYRKAIPKDNDLAKADPKTEKLRELKEWFDEGLITQEEYNQEKEKLIIQ